LILANVLIGALLARQRYAAVGWMVAIAVGYGLALALLRTRLLAMEEMVAFRTILQTLGLCSVLQLGVAAWFTLRGPTPPASGPEATQSGISAGL
jgi:hypothetical protein